MPRGVNKAIILGYLGKDPDVHHGNTTVANISVATTESWTDKQTGQKQERTEWHRVVFFSRLAEVVAEYLTKGSQVYIEGRIRTRKYQKDGQDRYVTEVVASEMQMLGGGRNKSDGGSQDRGYDHASENQDERVGMDKPAEDFDDDLPF